MTITLASASSGAVTTSSADAAAGTSAAGGARHTPLTQLDLLEAEAIHMIREVAGELERPVLLFSGGKDSVVMLHLAVKAFWPAPIPFPVLHVDTGHNFPEVLAFRDRTVERLGLRLVVEHGSGLDRRRPAAGAPRRHPQPAPDRQPLLDAIGQGRFDASSAAAAATRRRRAPRSGSSRLRDAFGQWDPRQPATRAVEPATTGGTRRGARARLPALNWTELDVWRYIERERIELPSSTTRTSARSSSATACGSPSARGASRAATSRRAHAPCVTGPSATCPAPAPSTSPAATVPRPSSGRGGRSAAHRARSDPRR
jgi:sulfate adenylyltransferase subunit 2